MDKSSIENLKSLCKPLLDFLNEHYNPYTAIVITDDTIRLVRTEMGVTEKEKDC